MLFCVTVAIIISTYSEHETVGAEHTVVAIDFGAWRGWGTRLGKEVLSNRYRLECGGLLDRVGTCVMLNVVSIFNYKICFEGSSSIGV